MGREQDKQRTDRQRTDKAPTPSDRDLGQALRSVYTETVDEGVPSELLDLLGKLD